MRLNPCVPMTALGPVLSAPILALKSSIRIVMSFLSFLLYQGLTALMGAEHWMMFSLIFSFFVLNIADTCIIPELTGFFLFYRSYLCLQGEYQSCNFCVCVCGGGNGGGAHSSSHSVLRDMWCSSSSHSPPVLFPLIHTLFWCSDYQLWQLSLLSE